MLTLMLSGVYFELLNHDVKRSSSLARTKAGPGQCQPRAPPKTSPLGGKETCLQPSPASMSAQMHISRKLDGNWRQVSNVPSSGLTALQDMAPGVICCIVPLYG